MKNLNKRFQHRHNDYLDTRKDKTSITKISKKFYNCLRQMYPNVNNAPGKEEVENFWIKKYGKKVQHNGEVGWIKNQYQQNPSMEWSPICEKDVAEALRTTLNWKAPGRDQIPNFCLKQLTATHRHIAAIFNKLIEEDQIPEWLMAGVTFLIPRTRILKIQRTTDQ